MHDAKADVGIPMAHLDTPRKQGTAGEGAGAKALRVYLPHTHTKPHKEKAWDLPVLAAGQGQQDKHSKSRCRNS